MLQKLNWSFSKNKNKNITENLNRRGITVKKGLWWTDTYYDAGASSFRVLLGIREGGSGGRVGGRQMELFSEKDRPFSPWASPVTHTHTHKKNHTPFTNILTNWLIGAWFSCFMLLLC